MFQNNLVGATLLMSPFTFASLMEQYIELVKNVYPPSIKHVLQEY